jgi:predicted nucleic acid-binding protein
MRTTLNLDEDLLRAVRSIANERGESIGTVVSSLVPDAHLLSIAIDHSGRLATFDRGLLDLAAPNTEHIELIG